MTRRRPGARAWLHALSCTAVLPAAVTAQGQQAPLPDWTVAAIHGDVLFGGAHGMEFRLHFDPRLELVGDPGAHVALLSRWRAQLDAAARDLVRANATAELWTEVQPFFASTAGHAMHRAELLSLCGYPWGDEFPEAAAAHFGDESRVGEAAVLEVGEARREVLEGHASVSPMRLALAVGATRLSAADAGAIGEFFASPAGQRWLAARKRAWPEAARSWWRMVQDGVHRGLVRSSLEGGDLLLPPPKEEPKEGQPEHANDDAIVVEVRCADRGTMVPVPDGDGSGADGARPQRFRLVGHTIYWVVGGREYRDGPQLVAALRDELRGAMGTDAATGARRLPPVRLVHGANTFWSDLHTTTDLAKQAGAVTVEIGGAADEVRPPKGSPK